MDGPRRLDEWPWVEVRVGCRFCTRQGCYRLARLAERYGAAMQLELLLNDLARDCPWNRSRPRKYEPRCGIRYLDWDLDRPKLDEPSRRNFVPPADALNPRLSSCRSPILGVTCAKCGRAGRYIVDRLIAQEGDIELRIFLTKLMKGCSRYLNQRDPCGAHFTGLGGEPPDLLPPAVAKLRAVR